MKKKLVASLAAAMVLGVAGTSFAASNPFVDVPAKHWAYDAVNSLAKAGIIDGMGDGRYVGEKNLTRYEVAQIVAKAMAHADKADAAQKATLEKLQAEFSDELNNLGVRVANLEKNQSKMKLGGDVRIRYDQLSGGTAAKTTAYKDRYRFAMTEQVNDNTTMYARYVFNDGNFDSNTAWLADLAMTTKLKSLKTDVTLGRYTVNLGPTVTFAGQSGGYEGIQTMTKVGNASLQAGYAKTRWFGDGYNDNVKFAEAGYQAGNLKLAANYYKDGTLKLYDISGGSLVYNFTPKLKVIGEFYSNNADNLADNTTDANLVRLSYGVADASKAGTWNLYFENNKFEKNALPYSSTGAFAKYKAADVGTTYGLKSNIIGGTYVLDKNMTFDALYQFGIKDSKTGNDAASTKFTRVQVNYLL